MITGLIGADLLILLSDIDGLFTDDPNSNPDAEFIHVVEKLDEKLLSMGKGPKSKVGTGGMATKLTAAEIATAAGADMVIANGADFHIIHKIVEGRDYGTLFVSDKKEEFFLIDYIRKITVTIQNCEGNEQLQITLKGDTTMGMDNTKIDRINTLAHKAKSVGLTRRRKG